MVILVAGCIGTAYGATIVAELPIGLPGVEYTLPSGNIPGSTKTIMNQWQNIVLYTPTQKHEDTQSVITELVESGEIVLPEVSNAELHEMFPIIEPDSLDKFLDENPEYLENGYQTLLIDKVDFLNTPTGIKTIHGDDVLAVDAINGIVIIGKDVVTETGTSKVKLAITNEKVKFDMSLVKDLSYWDIIEKHANENSNAVLAINASGYNWHESGRYAILYGATKWHGDVYRKAQNVEDLVCVDIDGNLTLGTPIEDAYNVVEGGPILVKSGELVIDPESDENRRSALSAIGQDTDGRVMMIIASGGMHGSNLGATPYELGQILHTYGAQNATTLSGGSRAIMYWNGRVVNETVGYDQSGVRLPNAFIIKQYDLEAGV